MFMRKPFKYQRGNCPANSIRMAFAVWVSAIGLTAAAHAQTIFGAGFTYQGQLKVSGSPYSGTADVQFKLFDSSGSPTQVGGTQLATNITINQGLFTVNVDFGDSSFDGGERWLEIAIRTPGNSAGAFTTVTPRQRLSPTPYALTSLYALDALIAGTHGDAVSFTNPANVLYGNGSHLTNLSAANLTGTLGSTLLSGTYASTVNLTNLANSFIGNGSGLTSLNAANITVGTLAITQGGTGATTAAAALANLNAPSLAAANTFAAGPQTIVTGSNGNRGLVVRGSPSQAVNLQEWQNVNSTVISGVNSNGALFGDGSGLTTLNATSLASGTIPSARLSGTYAGALTFSNASGTFSGNGAGLTSLNATSLGSGTVSDARLSSNVALLSGAQTFTGPKTFAGGVLTNLFQMSPNAIFGYVLRCDETGQGTWQPPPPASGTAGGDLTGTYPNPTITANAALLNRVSGGVMTSTSGLIGINTLNPAARLHVRDGSAGTIAPDPTSAVVLERSGNNFLQIYAPDANDTGILFGHNTLDISAAMIGTPSNGLQFRTGGNVTRMAVDSTGNVGIGTAFPSARLDVVGGASNTSFTVNPGTLFGVNNANAVTLDTPGSGTIGVWDNFIVNNNLGVGTPSPTAKLDVNGNANISGTLTAGSISVANAPGVEFNPSPLSYISLNAGVTTIDTIVVDIPAPGYLIVNADIYATVFSLGGSISFVLYDLTSGSTEIGRAEGIFSTALLQSFSFCRVLQVNPGQVTLRTRTESMAGTGATMNHGLTAMFVPNHY